MTWGEQYSGGDSAAVQDQLKDVRQLSATDLAFAAIRADGSVVTWGDPHSGGDSRAVQSELQNVQLIRGSSTAFAAILANGGCVTWGDKLAGGNRVRRGHKSSQSWWPF